MATFRQKKLAKAMVDNLAAKQPLNKEELVVSVGYSETVADKKATEILESKGVQEELKEMGFDVETAKAVVGEILMGGENDTVRLKAADMIFKVNDTYAPLKTDLTSKGDKIMTGESEIAMLAKQAAEILKEHDTDSSRPSET